MATRIPRLPTTFWLVLGCGALCGAATAAASPPNAPPLPAAASEAAAPPGVAMPNVAPAFAGHPVDTSAAASDAPPETKQEPARAPAAPAVAAEPLVLRTAPGPAPVVGGAPSRGLGLADLIAVLAVLGAAAVVFVQWRKQRPDAPAVEETLEVVASTRVGGRWQVSLMRVPGRLLVIGATDKGLSLLAELDGQDGTAAALPVASPSLEPAAADEPPILDLDAYRRPASPDPRRSPTPPPPDTLVGEDDAFLDHLMARLANAQPAVIRATTQPVNEQEALQRRVQHYRRGPTRI